MGVPRFKQIDGVWFRVFTDDRGRARRIRATAAELKRAGIAQDGPSDTSSRPAEPAVAGKEDAAPASASPSSAEEDDDTEDGERGTEDDSGSPFSLAIWILGAGLTLLAVTTVGAFLLLGPGRRGDEDLEDGNTGGDRRDDGERYLSVVP
jgi:hypothetical protein